MLPEYTCLEARRSARAASSGPGKFEGEPPIVALLWNELVVHGMSDAEVYDGDRIYYQCGRWILWSSDQGFVYGECFGTQAEASAEMADIIAAAEEQE